MRKMRNLNHIKVIIHPLKEKVTENAEDDWFVGLKTTTLIRADIYPNRCIQCVFQCGN